MTNDDDGPAPTYRGPLPAAGDSVNPAAGDPSLASDLAGRLRALATAELGGERLAAASAADLDLAGALAALREITFWRERARGETRRVLAYRKAADALAAVPPEDLAALGVSANAWKKLPGIGPSTAAVICSALAGAPVATLDAARAEAQLLLALDDAPARALASQLRGDLHAHTRESDGVASLEETAAVALALGREYQAITDHSPRLRIANGLSADRLRAQLAEIRELNAGFAAAGLAFRILTGIEVDILLDGSLDQDPDLLAELDVVVASVHSELKMPSEEMTLRMVRAVTNPRVNVLGHCTGRLVEGDRPTRGESQFDAEVVFEACAQFSTAVEISSRPERRDPPQRLIRLALEAGCLFSIDTDSHAPGQLAWLPWGAQRAAAGHIPADRIVTTWPLDRLLAWTRP